LAHSGEQQVSFNGGRLAALLEELRAAHPEVIADAVATRGGLLLASATGSSAEAEKLAAFGAGLLKAADAPADALAGGPAEEAYARGVAGHVIVIAAGPGAVLTAVAGPSASLHLLVPALREAADEIARAIAL
jgi:predicted regulator of Ras-like GTPase activity (Roadblock/LC7/MglB family)